MVKFVPNLASKFKNTITIVVLLTKFSVIGGPNSIMLAKKIAKRLDASFIKTELRIFPDGESKITLHGNPKNTKIVVVQSTNPPVDSNLIQALALITKAREYSPTVIAVIPYLGYARQDREFLPGEIVTMKIIADLFKSAGATKIVVVDIHSMIALKHFKTKVENVSAIQNLAMYFKKLRLQDPLVVSPDAGGKERAREFAKWMNVDFIALQKQRDRKTGRVMIKSPLIDGVKGKDLILVDDMISTGGSIVKATEFLKKQKCKRVFVACTHAILIEDAERKILKSGVSKIVSTNTIAGKTALVDISDIISEAIS